MTFSRMPTVWIGPLVIKELKRIVEASEITKYASYKKAFSGYILNFSTQGRRFELAEKRYRWEAGARN